MADHYANQYPSSMVHNQHAHQQYSQFAYSHQQPDSAYYPPTLQENYHQNHGMVGPSQEHNQGGYYPTPALDQYYHNQQQQQQHGNYFPYNDQYYEGPPKTPTVNKHTYNGPTLAPVDEAEAYRRKQYRTQYDNSGCSCCCYNPAMTCCSCFCMLISIAFVAVGIGLIVASTVIQSKCDDKCSEIPQKYRSETACGTICDKIVHDSLFYSGIGVTALAGLGVIWRLFTWTCAGCSKH